MTIGIHTTTDLEPYRGWVLMDRGIDEIQSTIPGTENIDSWIVYGDDPRGKLIKELYVRIPTPNGVYESKIKVDSISDALKTLRHLKKENDETIKPNLETVVITDRKIRDKPKNRRYVNLM